MVEEDETTADDPHERYEEMFREMEEAPSSDGAQGKVVGTAESWDFDERPDLAGQIEAIRPLDDEEYPLVFIRTPEDDLVMTGIRWAVLKRRWDDEEPTVGDHIAIRHKGMKEGASHDYRDFDMMVTDGEIGDGPARGPDEEYDRDLEEIQEASDSNGDEEEGCPF